MSRRIEAKYRLDRGRFALDVDIDLPMDGITGLFGVSGAGKTSLLRCIAGLERATDAKLVIDGETLEDRANGVSTPVHRRGIAVVFQEPRLFGHLDVGANIRYGARRNKPATGPAFDDVVDLLGLAHLLDQSAGSLSGGEAQRVAIARALLCSPRLVLLDEPLAGLDARRRDEVLPYLENLHATLSVPLIYVSHQQDEILRLADTLVIMEDGTVAAAGSVADVLASTREATAVPPGMIAAVLDGTARATHEEFALTEVTTAAGPFWVTALRTPGTPLRLVVRASDVSVSKHMPEGSSIQNQLPATILRIDEESPATVLLVLEAGGATLLSRVTRKAVAELGLTPGTGVFAQVKSAAVRKAAAPLSVPVPA